MSRPLSRFVLSLALAGTLVEGRPAHAACDCKCVVKDEDGKYSTMEASGKNRTEAGEKLKAKLKKRKCEITPVCSGSCKPAD